MEDFLKKIAHRVYGKSKSVTDKHYHIRLYQVHYIYYFHSLWVCVKIATIEVIIIIVKVDVYKTPMRSCHGGLLNILKKTYWLCSLI